MKHLHLKVISSVIRKIKTLHCKHLEKELARKSTRCMWLQIMVSRSSSLETTHKERWAYDWQIYWS